jgi:hypothetical protein
MSGYNERDAAHDTKTPEREVTAAWHQARDDANVRGGRRDDRPTRENRDRARDLTRDIIERGRNRPPDRPGDSRPGR